MNQCLVTEKENINSRSNLYHGLKFYKTFLEIVDTACRQSGVLLSWSHYRTLLQVKDPEARDWYEKEAAEQTWSVRTLQRNISSQYYYRMLRTQKKELVESEMKELTAPYQNDQCKYNHKIGCVAVPTPKS